jgi:hypothetical protein
MRATDVISTLQARGVTLHPEGGNIRIKGASRISATEKTAIKAHKGALLRALEPPPTQPTTIPRNAAVAPAVAVTEPAGPCPTCGSHHFWLAPTGWQCWGCTEPPPRATTLCIPAYGEFNPKEGVL